MRIPDEFMCHSSDLQAASRTGGANSIKCAVRHTEQPWIKSVSSGYACHRGMIKVPASSSCLAMDQTGKQHIRISLWYYHCGIIKVLAISKQASAAGIRHFDASNCCKPPSSTT
eukprot:662027-Pelagomonas_calceolata.AAC.4